MTGADLAEATGLATDLLRTIPEPDWSTEVPGIAPSISHVVTHVGMCCAWYAVDLTAAGRDLTPLQLEIEAGHPPDDLIATLETTTTLLGRLVDGADPGQRGFHPMGQADPSGFAAMGCDEVLVHGWDVAQVLGRDLRPADHLAERVVRRLFPWIAPASDPWSALLFANGRIDWDGNPRLDPHWAWHCAPLDEWDGTIPRS